MKAFLGTCLFLALFLPGMAATVACRSTDSDPDFDFCAISNGVCFKQFFVGHLSGSDVEENLQIGCAGNCPATNYSFTVPEGYVQSIINCCDEYLCNDRDINYTPHHYNGRRCPFYDTCDPDVDPKSENVHCNGDETQCIEFVLVRGDNAVPKKLYIGCATPSFCKLAKGGPYIDYLEGTISEARCGETLPS